jgi:stage IV sporulation protein FB
MNILITAVLLVASVALHEWAHVFAVRFFGGRIERVGIFPMGMMAKARRLERLDSWERYVIFAAGAGVNFAIALWAFGVSYLSYVGVAWLDELAFYNFVLGVFNLTPALPLDGGRIALQFLGNRVGILRAGRLIMRVGKVVSCAFIFFGIIQMILFPLNITLLCAGILISKKNKAITPELQAEFHLALDGKNSRARTLHIKEISISAETPLKHAFERIAGDYFIVFNVNEKKIREQAIVKHIFAHGLTGTVGEIANV